MISYMNRSVASGASTPRLSEASLRPNQSPNAIQAHGSPTAKEARPQLHRVQTELLREVELQKGQLRIQAMQIGTYRTQLAESQMQIGRINSQLSSAQLSSMQNFQSSEYHKGQVYRLTSQKEEAEIRNLGQLQEIMMLKEQLYNAQQSLQDLQEPVHMALPSPSSRVMGQAVAQTPPSPPKNSQWAQLNKWADKEMPSLSKKPAVDASHGSSEEEYEWKMTDEAQGTTNFYEGNPPSSESC